MRPFFHVDVPLMYLHVPNICSKWVIHHLKKKKKKCNEKKSRKSAPTPGGRETVTQISVCIANNQMHDAQRPAPSSPSKVIKMLKGQKKHIDKEQGKTKHEAPRSVTYRATQNKNNRLRTVRLSMWGGGEGGGGVKSFSLYKLHPGSRYNS